MPTMVDLAKLASQLYKGNPSIEDYDFYDGQWDQDAATALGFTSPNFYLWSGENTRYSAYGRLFYSTASSWSSYYNRFDSNNQAVCIAD